MTKQESFKRRVRQRMEKTGERYVAARRALIEQAAGTNDAGNDGGSGRTWVSPPEMSDEAVRAATGKGWNEWCDLIDAWPGHTDGHASIATHVQEQYGIDGWWSQTVTVGYERITGLRLPYQRADGTFAAGKSRTLDIDGDLLRKLLLSDDDRADLFPGIETELRSGPTAKTLRIGIGGGLAQIAIADSGTGVGTGVKVSIAHEQLPSYNDVELWKQYWSEWLDALEA